MEVKSQVDMSTKSYTEIERENKQFSRNETSFYVSGIVSNMSFNYIYAENRSKLRHGS